MVILDDAGLMQDSNPEPERVPTTSGWRQRQLRKKKGFGYRGKSILLIYSNPEAKPTMVTLIAEFAKHRYQFRELVDCFVKHRATRDPNREVLAEGKWPMHIFGHLCLNSSGDPPMIKNVYHAYIQPPRNPTGVW